MEIPVGSGAIWLVLVVAVLGLWRVLNWLWLRPKKMERELREQGIMGNSYRVFYGDVKAMMAITRAGASKPLNNLSNDVMPRVLPYHNHLITKYGKKCFLWNGMIPTVIITDPDLVDEILTKNNNFRKPTPSPTLRLLLSGLAGYEGDKWAKHRRIMNPAFYLDKLKHMLPAMHMCCSEMVSQWEEIVSEKGSSCEVDVSPYLQNLAANVIARTAFGSSFVEGRRIFELQVEQAQLVFRLSVSLKFPGQRFLPTKINKRIKEINDEVQVLVAGLINERQIAMKLGKIEVGHEDLLSVLLKANMREIEEHGNNKNAGMSTDEVIKECKLMYFVGQETTAQLIVWTMIMLSIHPDWQMRAREEVRQVFGNNQPHYDGIIRLKIMAMILNEVLRLYPPAIMMNRVNSKRTKLGEMVIPAGTNFTIPILFLHHDKDFWGEDSNEFKPERFSEGIAKATKKQACFQPFGLGPRICIGNNFASLEAKIALVTILQHFSFELSPSYTHTPCFRISLQPQNGAHLILRKI